MLWAWERNTDLRFLKPADAGVAYHFASLLIERGGGVRANLRRQPLLLPPDVYRLPVVRVDAETGAAFSPSQRSQVAAMIEEAVRLTRTRAVQIDFDAPKSGHAFYRTLLEDIRRRLGPRVFISITALVSWCGAGSWMSGLSVDEIVPMTFRMGSQAPPIPEQFPFPACRTSVGFEVGPALKLPNDGRRVYIFPGYRNWDAKVLRSLQK